MGKNYNNKRFKVVARKVFWSNKSSSEIAKRLGIKQALGSSEQGKLALFQIAGRIITQGSRNYLAV